MKLTHKCPTCGKEHELDCTPEPDHLCPECEEIELDRAKPMGQPDELENLYDVWFDFQKIKELDERIDALKKVVESIKKETFCKCGGYFIVDDDQWKSRKHCNKCNDYIDLSGVSGSTASLHINLDGGNTRVQKDEIEKLMNVFREEAKKQGIAVVGFEYDR